MVKIYTIRANAKIMSLLAEIIELERNQDTTRIAIFERALEDAKKEVNWDSVFNTEIEERKDIDVPETFQVRADEEDMDKILKKMQVDIKCIQKFRTVLVIRLILCNYLKNMRSKVGLVGGGGITAENTDMTGPEMVKTLVEMLLMNRITDAEMIGNLKKEFINWRLKVYGE